MSTSQYTFVQQRPPGGGVMSASPIVNGQMVAAGSPHIIRTVTYKAAVSPPRNVPKLLPAQATHFQYQRVPQQQQQQPSHHQPAHHQLMNVPMSPQIHQQQQQQQQLFIETLHQKPEQPTNFLTEIKTEPMAFSPSSPSSNSGSSPHLQSVQAAAVASGEVSPPWKQSLQGAPVQQSVPKKQKGPAPRPQEELCLVCADRASGYHYNALACEGCKGFFRRSITRNASYACKYGDACEIDMYMRRKCQACRLRKCYSVGMKPECVIPEQQCKSKREEKKRKDDMKKEPEQSKRLRLGAEEKAVPRVLLPEEEELINRLVFFQREFESPSATDLSKIYHVPMSGSSTSESEQLFRHMTEMTILTVQLIVDFSKHLPGFQTLCRDDQVVLLKGCSSEVMMLRGARKYDPATDSIVYATNHPFTKDNYVKAGIESEDLFRFCRRMTNMKVDNAEFALVTAIDIFSGRHGLYEPKRVEKIQEIYVDALHSYVMANRRSAPMIMFSKLLSVLTELRSLGYNNSRMCIELRMEKNKKLPDFLEEIWDLK